MNSIDNRLGVLEYILIQGKGGSVPARNVKCRFRQDLPVITELQNDGFISLVGCSSPRSDRHYDLTGKAILYLLETA